MGVTSFDIPLIEKYLPEQRGLVIELGAQNNYTNPLPAPYMREWYKARDLQYVSIDITGENGSYPFDLSKPLPTEKLGLADLVTDFGTSEHVGTTLEDYYQCWLNKWNLCRVGGYIISENPMTGNWPGHGKNYLGQEFYAHLIAVKVIDSGINPAMHNTKDGWNVWGVIQKTDNLFLCFQQFKDLPIFTS